MLCRALALLNRTLSLSSWICLMTSSITYPDLDLKFGATCWLSWCSIDLQIGMLSRALALHDSNGQHKKLTWDSKNLE